MAVYATQINLGSVFYNVLESLAFPWVFIAANGYIYAVQNVPLIVAGYG